MLEKQEGNVGMNLKQVKNAVFWTECRDCVREGMCCSEPIMTWDGRGIVDNYFVYGENGERKSYSGPVVSFGVYSEQKEAAYIKRGREMPFSKGAEDEIVAVSWEQYDGEAYERYQKAFPLVRGFLFEENCTEEQREILKSYLQAFRMVTDGGLWPLYLEMAPEFFRWAKKMKCL